MPKSRQYVNVGSHVDLRGLYNARPTMIDIRAVVAVVIF
jgi:hypothetical protein